MDLACNKRSRPDERGHGFIGSKSKAGVSHTTSNEQLIPGLPDDAATLCLARVTRSMVPTLCLVCKAWREMVKSQSFLLLRQQVKSSEGWIYVLTETPSGAPFKVYDPSLNKWHSLPPTPGISSQQSWQGFACVALGCCLYLMGGVHRSFNPSTQKWSEGIVSADVKVYNAQTNVWSAAASMKSARSWFAASVIGERVYVAGGQGVSRFLHSAEVYDTSKDEWFPIKSMNFIRFSCSGMSLAGRFWVIAGEYMRSQYEDKPKKGSAEVYDPQSEAWQVVQDMWLDSHKVPGPNTVINDNPIFIHTNKIMAYDHAKNCWTQVGHLSGSSRFGFACESLDGKLYIIGGARESWQNHNRHHIHTLNNVEVSSNLSAHQPHFSYWRQAADLGHNKGTVLACAVVRF